MSGCMSGYIERNQLYMEKLWGASVPLGTFAFVEYVLDLNNNRFKMWHESLMPWNFSKQL